MKNLINIILFSIFLININYVNAWSVNSSKVTITPISEDIQNEISREDVFNFYADYYKKEVASSYKYIKVNYLNVNNWSDLEDSLKVLIYLDLISNPSIDFKVNSKLNAWSFFRLSEKILKIQINDFETESQLKNRNVTKDDLNAVEDFIIETPIKLETKTTNIELKQKLAIMQNVYDTITNSHYNKENIDSAKLIDSAIEWIAKWTDDKFTVYFPPVESESFQDTLAWDYEWIGSYVDMEKPWAVRIVSPIPGSPSEQAWLKGWDLVIKVDGREITEENSLKEVVSWIKGPAWTIVTLTVNRNWKIFNLDVIRARIVINNIDSEKLNTTTQYIQIKSFWEHVSTDFKEAVNSFKDDKNINKIIIDLRNNWGWYLTEVAEILSYFIDKNETTAVVKYHDSTKTFISKWYDLINFKDYKIIVLQNSGTASASEIMIWTLKDYYKDLELIGEKTYGKWSVQVMKWYTDWSLLKYTIAKWFTGLTETGIDWIWIEPTIKLEFDLENFKKNWFDNQLDKAIFID